MAFHHALNTIKGTSNNRYRINQECCDHTGNCKVIGNPKTYSYIKAANKGFLCYKLFY